MQDRPDIAELLEAVTAFLREQVVPATEGQVAFYARVAANIVAHRDENGPFKSRKELQKVSGLGPKAFEQAGIKHQFKLTDGRHEWTVWRHHLQEVAPLLFK